MNDTGGFSYGRIIIVVLLLGLILSPASALAMITDAAGGGGLHENRQPYLGVNLIIRLEGTYDEIGEIGLFAGNFAPRGWAFADGRLLQIASHTALFSKIWDTYGGNATSDFALPRPARTYDDRSWQRRGTLDTRTGRFDRNGRHVPDGRPNTGA